MNSLNLEKMLEGYVTKHTGKNDYYSGSVLILLAYATTVAYNIDKKEDYKNDKVKK